MSLQLEWLRTCSVSYLDTRFIRNPITGDVIAATASWDTIPPRCGQLLMSTLYREEETPVPDTMPAQGDLAQNTLPCLHRMLTASGSCHAFHVADWVIDDPAASPPEAEDIGRPGMSSLESYVAGMPMREC